MFKVNKFLYSAFREFICFTLKKMSNNNNCVNRLIGRLPKVGIRPVIDARLGGARESLEGQTMQMAESVKKLITENLRHPCGAPVECVISDSTIGRAAEAAACDDKFARESVGVSITVTPCWCYGSETMDMNPYTPKAVWGFNGSERPGAVYLAAVRALSWVRQNCREGSGVNTGRKLTREKKDSDWQNIIKMTLIARDLMIGNPKLKQLGYGEEALGFNAIAAGFQGQRQWTDYFPTGDFMETILCSSFDWNGIRQPFILATENDCLNAVSMLFGHLLANTASVFADVRTYWSPEAVERVTGTKLKGLGENGIIHLINSGAAALDGSGEQEIDNKPAMKPFWDITEEEVKKCLDATLFHPANPEYFRGGGFSTSFLTRGNMPVTMIRLNLVKGIGPVLQLAEGYTVELPKEVHETLNKRTDPTWPTTWFAPVLTGKGAFRDVYQVMANWGANHASFSYGHIGAELITFASILRIPVCMHNVSEERIFRPATWAAFGTQDHESADFRACAALGPLYR